MKNNIPLVLILVIASVFRLYQLGSIPIELNRDEASIGYTAYSLLNTGADEYGRKWPLNVESFGDWKLPVYQWFTIPSVAIFGLSAWAVRLPSAIAGIVSVHLIYQLFLLVSNQLKMRQNYALLTAFLLAILPWHIHFSRMAYETNLAVTLFLLGFVTLLHSLKHSKPTYLLLAGCSFGLTMITYHAFQLITPLFVLLVMISFKKEVRQYCNRNFKYFIYSLIILVLPILLLVMTGVTNSNQVKLSGLSIFEEATYYQRLFTKRKFFSDNQEIFAKLYTNIPMELFRQLMLNSTIALNPDFLFINGGSHGSHDIAGIGKFFSLTLPFLILGSITIFTRYSLFDKKIPYVIIFWLLIAVLPAAITWEPAHATRSYAVFVPLLLLIVQGIYWFMSVFPKRFEVMKLLTIVGMSLVLSYQVFSMSCTYFIIAPQRDVNNWTWYAQNMVTLLETAGDQVDHLYVQGNSWSPYIYYLFYAQIDPRYAQANLRYLPADAEGFRHVSGIDKIEFGDIPYQHLLESGDSYALFAPVSSLPAGFSQDPQKFDLYEMYSKANSKASYVAIIKK